MINGIGGQRGQRGVWHSEGGFLVDINTCTAIKRDCTVTLCDRTSNQSRAPWKQSVHLSCFWILMWICHGILNMLFVKLHALWLWCYSGIDGFSQVEVQVTRPVHIGCCQILVWICDVILNMLFLEL